MFEVIKEIAWGVGIIVFGALYAIDFYLNGKRHKKRMETLLKENAELNKRREALLEVKRIREKFQERM